jgi:hypothetical protein
VPGTQSYIDGSSYEKIKEAISAQNHGKLIVYENDMTDNYSAMQVVYDQIMNDIYGPDNNRIFEKYGNH